MRNTENIETQFNEEFCIELEYRICSELKESKDPNINGFWCDGISWFPNDSQLTKKNVNNKREIVTKAWIGKSGQEEYQATIQFGKKALSNYAKDKNLIECIPGIESETSWIEISPENKSIEIKLT